MSRDISANGVRLTISPEGLEERALGIRTQHELQLRLPEQHGDARGTAEIVWKDDSSVDVGNRPVTEIGMRVLRWEKRDARTMERFLETFRYTVLVANADAAERAFAAQTLEPHYRVVQADSLRSAANALEAEAVAVLLSSFPSADLEQHGVLAKLRGQLPTPQIVIKNGVSGEELIRELIELGTELHHMGPSVTAAQLHQVVYRAVDIYALSAENDQLRRALERANRRLRRENTFLRRRQPHHFSELVGDSAALRGAVDELDRIRHAEVAVHLQGETGTGKELVARALHDGSPRSRGPFVAQNCAGLPDTLLQSTLFGHRRGAFTGADRDHQGVFQVANGGTLFLDEVAELSPPAQGALLRVLQDGLVTPVGASRPISVDVRLISASHKPLRAEVDQGRFREDLFYRLGVVTVTLPPLRSRQGDVPTLAMHFLELASERYGKDVEGFSEEAMALLEAHSWPGNVRELAHEVERAVIVCDQPHIGSEHLSDAIRDDSPVHTFDLEECATRVVERLRSGGGGLDDILGSLERGVLEIVLREHAYNRSATARTLGIPRQTLLSRLERHQLREEGRP